MPHATKKMTLAALFVGLLIAAEGLVGLAAPDAFVEIVRWFQTAPVIYGAAVVRVAVGVVLFCAAAASRMPALLRGLGVLIAIGGLLTPVAGIQLARVVLGWWSEGAAPLVRVWAGGAVILGALIVYAAA